MTDRQTRSGFGGMVIGALVMLTVAVPGTVHAQLRTTPTEPPTTEPATSEPPTTEPGTEPPTTEPATTGPTDGATEGTDDDGVDTGVAILGIVGFFALVGVAAWWMIRLKNDDDEPHPRQPGLDDPLPGQDLL